MKISLITVSYNSEATIRETFESVQKQKIQGFELEYIHVDGLSTDATMEISMEFDGIVTKRISEKDSGIYNAMNKGIQMATGDVIGFLNSDDTFCEFDVLFSISQCFLNDSSLGVVYGDINYTEGDHKIIRRWRTGKQRSFLTGWHPAHPGFYAKKALFGRYGGFDETLRIAADFDLMLRFIEVKSTANQYLNKTLVNMKLGGESNASMRNILRGNKEIRMSFTKYGMSVSILYTIKRLIKKVKQYK
jgi:glycosyltransferase involved in cell wall biosynthesis